MIVLITNLLKKKTLKNKNKNKNNKIIKIKIKIKNLIDILLFFIH